MFYLVPFTLDIKNFLMKFHINSNHLNYKYLINSIQNKGFYYKGIYKDIKDLTKN